MSELYYPTTPEQCIAPEQELVKEGKNLMGKVAGAIGYSFRCVGFIMLLGVSGIGMLILSLALVGDEREC